jgi:protein SCO1
MSPPPPSGGPIGRLVSRPLFWVLTVTVLFALPLGRSIFRHLPPPAPVLGSVPAFTMTDQQGRSFGSANLEGRVWVADFIFTSCQTMCPLLTEKMAQLVHRSRQLGPEVHFVSFSVDPERDTPGRLADYARRYHADPRKWSFLTGTLASVQGAVVDGFKIGVDRHKTADDFWDIVHGEHMVIVDRGLRIRGYFDSSEGSLNQLLETLGQVTNEPVADALPRNRQALSAGTDRRP